jgi:hypothetical protein
MWGVGGYVFFLNHIGAEFAREKNILTRKGKEKIF